MPFKIILSVVEFNNNYRVFTDNLKKTRFDKIHQKNGNKSN